MLVNLAPVLLLPLFFTFKPLQKEVLCDRLPALASKAGTRVMGVYEWTLSDRTKKANAALTGIGHTRRILLSDTLLADYSDDEIEVILAHELAHHVHRDIWTSIVFDMALTFAGFFAAHRLLQYAVPFFGLHGVADPAGVPVLLLTAGDPRAVHEAGDERGVALARTAGRFVRAQDDQKSFRVHYRDEAARAAESRRRKPVAARAGVLLHASADQGTAARGAGDCRLARSDHQLPDHLLALFVDRKIAVNRKAAGLIGPEFEDDRFAGLDAFGDPVLVDREAVRDVVCRETDPDEIVLSHLNACGTKP